LKYGVAVVVAQDIPAVTAARSPSVAPVAIMQLKLSTLLRDGSILFVQAALGPVLNRTLVMQEWAVVHLLLVVI
jgi:hypothetical protein